MVDGSQLMEVTDEIEIEAMEYKEEENIEEEVGPRLLGKSAVWRLR